MDNIETLKKAVTLKLSNYKLYFSKDELPKDLKLPDEWCDFGIRNSSEVWMPSKWSDYSSKLPVISKWLKECILGTAIALGDKLYLVYIYAEDNNLRIYLGGAPLGNESLSLEKYGLSLSLDSFYKQLHDGFFFYVDLSMGPSRLQDFVVIDDVSEEACCVPELVGFFSNGMGDYIASSANESFPGFYIWWHEEQDKPEKEIDVWAVMDAWMGIFIENSDSNEYIIGSHV